MKFTDTELNVIAYAIDELIRQGWKKHGTLTIEEALTVASKLRFRDYCERHGITYEQMDDLDFEQAYREEYEA